MSTKRSRADGAEAPATPRFGAIQQAPFETNLEKPMNCRAETEGHAEFDDLNGLCAAPRLEIEFGPEDLGLDEPDWMRAYRAVASKGFDVPVSSKEVAAMLEWSCAKTKDNLYRARKLGLLKRTGEHYGADWMAILIECDAPIAPERQRRRKRRNFQ